MDFPFKSSDSIFPIEETAVLLSTLAYHRWSILRLLDVVGDFFCALNMRQTQRQELAAAVPDSGLWFDRRGSTVTSCCATLIDVPFISMPPWVVAGRVVSWL